MHIYILYKLRGHKALPDADGCPSHGTPRNVPGCVVQVAQTTGPHQYSIKLQLPVAH